MPQWQKTEQRPKLYSEAEVSVKWKHQKQKVIRTDTRSEWNLVWLSQAEGPVWWRFLALVDYFMKQWATDTLSSQATYSESFLLNCSLVLLLVKASLSLKPHSTPAHISRTKSEIIWRKEMGVGVLLYFLQRKPSICLCSFTGSRLLSIKTSKFPWMNLSSPESPLTPAPQKSNHP